MPTTVSLVHLGCARNLIDSELILARMAEEGLMVSGQVEGSNAAVLNTCSFIGPARAESEAAIEDLLERKRAGDLQHVVVAGCLVQRYKRGLAARYPEVDLFAEISDYRQLASTLRKLTEGQEAESYLESPGLREARRDGARLLATPGSYAYLRISHGCDHTCSFCAIPGIRGTHRSKRPADLIEESTELVNAGVRELVLVAEDSTAWGRDLGTELPDLMAALADLPIEAGTGESGQQLDYRLRLMYAYPNRFPWGLTELLRDHPRVEPYLDIPMQHISTPVLRGMRRAGNGDQVRKILDRLLDEVPNLTLRSTLLVGFPGETEQDVDELEAFVRQYRLGRLGAFSYSPEEDTSAFDTELPQVPEAQAQERLDRILGVRDEVLQATQQDWVGREVEVLVDEASTFGEASFAVGRTCMDAPEVDPMVIVQAADLAVGQRATVRVEAVDEQKNLIASVPEA